MNYSDDYPEPRNRLKVFKGEIWNSFNALGLKYTCFLYPKQTYWVRLLHPKGSRVNEWATSKEVFDYLLTKNLAFEFEDEHFTHHGMKVKYQYRLTKLGEKLFGELSQDENFREKFFEKINN